jgi:uncharacterized membrane protein YfcA
MGFGPISATILLGAGLPPAAASATINIAKIASGAAAAISHWRFRNIDRRIIKKLAIPGMAGAAIGATVLASVDGAQLRPILAGLLVLVGARMLWRFSRGLTTRSALEGAPSSSIDERGIAAAGFTGGVTNGLVGAWGPVVTPVLLHKGFEPRYAVGSVNTAEVAVAVVAAGSLLATAGTSQLDLGVVLAMLVGGLIAAPIAAWVIRFIPARALGVAVAGLLLWTNVRELLRWGGVSSAATWAVYGAVAALVAAAAVRPMLELARSAKPAA